MAVTNLAEIGVFARVVQAESFTAAARQLGMPKSSVSRKIAELEDRVGARLLQRTTRRLRLTDAGRIYYEHAQRIVAELEEADRAVASMQETPRGLLRVSTPLQFQHLGPLSVDFLRRYPEVRLDVVCTDRRVNLIEEGFDVAIRAGSLDDSTLIARSLGTMRWMLVAAPGFCKAHGTPAGPADLEKLATIAFAVGAAPSTWTLRSGEHTVQVKIAPRLAINDFEVVAEAAMAGVGITLVPDFMYGEELRAGKLRHLLKEWRSPEVAIHAVYPSARHLSPKVAAFIEAARQRFGGTMTVP